MSKKISKRRTYLQEVSGKPLANCTLEEGLQLLITHSSQNFTESIDLSIKLGIIGNRSDHAIRSFTTLPHGTGRDKKIVVITTSYTSTDLPDALEVGGPDLVRTINTRPIYFDLLLASPDMMRYLAVLGKKLGPKGIMPSERMGTISSDLKHAVSRAKNQAVYYRSDKFSMLNMSIGTCKFSVQELIENFQAVITDVRALAPSNLKGPYIKNIAISSTMGLSFTVPPTYQLTTST